MSVFFFPYGIPSCTTTITNCFTSLHLPITKRYISLACSGMVSLMGGRGTPGRNCQQ